MKNTKYLSLTIFLVIILGIALFLFIFMTTNDLQVTSDTVSNFEECIAAGNPAMESYPRQCRHNDRTYIENLYDTIGSACNTSNECQVPMKYMVQSNCPYQAFCRNSECIVACPLWEHSQIPEESISYKVSCTNNSDCNCSEWDRSNKYPCECLDGQCASVVETKDN